MSDEHELTIEKKISAHQWSHQFKNVWQDFNGVKIFIGIECECGAFIPKDKLAQIVTHYYDLDMHRSVIQSYIQPFREL